MKTLSRCSICGTEQLLKDHYLLGDKVKVCIQCSMTHGIQDRAVAKVDAMIVTVALAGGALILVLTALFGCQSGAPYSGGIDCTHMKAKQIATWKRGEVGTADAYGQE